ncbi:uncharacterized protein [Notamacropus eugenii]|uniref:uncharacterized protein isoform X1 n=1 Tax=Notamacropus eugenii TaxID=9315 RepID=UPI003B66C648
MEETSDTLLLYVISDFINKDTHAQILYKLEMKDESLSAIPFRDAPRSIALSVVLMERLMAMNVSCVRKIRKEQFLSESKKRGGAKQQTILGPNGSISQLAKLIL